MDEVKSEQVIRATVVNGCLSKIKYGNEEKYEI